MRNGAQDFGHELGPALDKWAHQLPPGSAIGPKCRFRGSQVTLQSDCGAIIEGMSEGGWRVDPVESEVAQRQRRKEWRSRCERMHSRAEIMMKAGQSQLESAGGATRLRLGLIDVNTEACLGEDNASRQSVRT